MNEKDFEKLEQEVEMMLDNENAELDLEKIQKLFDTYAQHFKEAAEWLRSRSKDSAEDPHRHRADISANRGSAGRKRGLFFRKCLLR